jgi:hypothetical protein
VTDRQIARHVGHLGADLDLAGAGLRPPGHLAGLGPGGKGFALLAVDGHLLPRPVGRRAVMERQAARPKMGIVDLPPGGNLAGLALLGLELQLWRHGIDDHPQFGPLGPQGPESAGTIHGPNQKPELTVGSGAKHESPPRRLGLHLAVELPGCAPVAGDEQLHLHRLPPRLVCRIDPEGDPEQRLPSGDRFGQGAWRDRRGGLCRRCHRRQGQ